MAINTQLTQPLISLSFSLLLLIDEKKNYAIIIGHM